MIMLEVSVEGGAASVVVVAAGVGVVSLAVVGAASCEAPLFLLAGFGSGVAGFGFAAFDSRFFAGASVDFRIGLVLREEGVMFLEK